MSEFDPRRIADLIERNADRMGLSADVSASGLSASRYIAVRCRCEGDCDHQAARVRISDHEAKPTYEKLNGIANYEVGTHGMAHTADWAEAVLWLARRFDATAPRHATRRVAHIEAERSADAERRAAADEAHRAAVAERSATRAAAMGRIASDPAHVARLEELQARLADPAITGNRRKKVYAKIRELLARA